MNLINSESIEIILEIANLNKKLIKSILPEKTMNHLDVIGNELKLMVLESLSDSLSKYNKTDNLKTKKVNKVEIG